MTLRFPLRRALAGLTLAIAPIIAQPAAAQFFWSPPDMSAPPLTDDAAAAAMGLPGATAAEVKAGLAWNLRAALNVAALQCQFEPTLLAISNYNAMIAHHDAELDSAQAALLGYFQRTVGKGKPGQSASDMYNTRIYSGYSTVQAQKGFCQATAEVGRQAIFAERGTLHEVGRAGLGSIKKSLVAAGEQFYGTPGYDYVVALPSFDPKCWKKGVLLPACHQAWNNRTGVKP
ncbi:MULTISPECIES: hypothetical protein [Sphingomonadaceae]|uniref:Uncharacterized protein n=1 Tax=Sphingomonas bisphenolicum TaxID=296544 RepID=A0ABM7G223_9SPHN|nr:MULTISPECIES: hypothetical protein [Sphingomonadaceae]MBZ9647959.1 hypothetical protein [Sphingobium sp. 3R8]BBF69043.1 hypothetical protein SBA_ch1_12430 [Sphingomonas bisphenolicum]